MELLYADDPVLILCLIAETKELLLEKMRNWKEGMEKKGLRVITGKTNIMWCRLSMGQAEDSGEHPCDVGRKGVSDNSFFCVECWGWSTKDVLRGISEKFECIPNFCYLGYTLGVGGGVKKAARARVRCAWAKFKELSPILTARGASYVDEVARRGRLRWFGHVERKNGDNYVSACRNVVVAGVRHSGRGRKTWYECVTDDMKALGLHPEWAVFRNMWRGFISGEMSNPSWAWKDGRFENKWWWWCIKFVYNSYKIYSNI